MCSNNTSFIEVIGPRYKGPFHVFFHLPSAVVAYSLVCRHDGLGLVKGLGFHSQSVSAKRDRRQVTYTIEGVCDTALGHYVCLIGTKYKASRGDSVGVNAITEAMGGGFCSGC